jgi:hypothetical protein
VVSFRPRLESEDLRITQEVRFWWGSDWSTTVVGTWQGTDLDLTIQIPDGDICMYAWCELNVEHTVAGATFDIELDLYKDDSLLVYYGFCWKQGLYIPAANARVSASLSGGYNIGVSLPNVVRPGNRLLKLWVKNNTAGTLTLRDFRILHAFVTGDDST